MPLDFAPNSRTGSIYVDYIWLVVDLIQNIKGATTTN